MWTLVKFKLMEDITIPFKSRKDSTSSGKIFVILEVDCKLGPWQVLISSSHSGRYSQTLLYIWHPLIMDNSLLRTVCFVPGKKSPYVFSKSNPLNTDTFYGPFSFRINGVCLCCELVKIFTH